MSVLNKIEMVRLPTTQYYNEETPKRQIFIHHTAGHSNPYNDIHGWAQTPARIATAFIIGGQSKVPAQNLYDGKILQTYSSKNWAYHLGLKNNPNKLDKFSIGIELCNFGHVIKRPDGKFQTYVGSFLHPDQVIDLGYKYKGYQFYQLYTDAQIESLRELLDYLCTTWNIPRQFKGMEMFNVDKRALAGEPGIWTHTSVRADKNDCSPQPKLIKMLKEL
jgi:hypothetical protein